MDQPIERQKCPRCGNTMRYIFAMKRPDPVVDSYLNRMQECNVCSIKINVITRRQLAIKRRGLTLEIDGLPYAKVEDWLYTTGQLAKPESQNG